MAFEFFGLRHLVGVAVHGYDAQRLREQERAMEAWAFSHVMGDMDKLQAARTHINRAHVDHDDGKDIARALDLVISYLEDQHGEPTVVALPQAAIDAGVGCQCGGGCGPVYTHTVGDDDDGDYS